MTAPADCLLIGKWRIMEAELVFIDDLELVEPAYVVFQKNGQGQIAFGAMQAGLDLEYSRGLGFFTWAAGRGLPRRIPEARGPSARIRKSSTSVSMRPCGAEASIRQRNFDGTLMRTSPRLLATELASAPPSPNPSR